MMSPKVILIILDGWGYAPAWGGNAVEMAETPVFDNLWRKFPHAVLAASQEAVGLPKEEAGNSEVGHLNIGCGQIVRQNLPGISKEISDATFFQNPVLLEIIERARKNNGNIHLLGLVSDGGVHSHINHLFALLDLLKRQNFNKVYIHMITDGRDTDPMKALSYLSRLEEKIKEVGFGRIESVIGRYFAMDRDNRWDRTQKAYDCLTLGIGPRAESAEKAISESYRQGQYDEFILPTAIENTEKFVPITAKDSVIFYNFRADRSRQLTWAFVKKDFHKFNRQTFLDGLDFATFAFHEEYEEKLPVKVVFRPSKITSPLAKVLSDHHLKQYHTAETEKYAHITYFLNGGQEKPFLDERRQLVPSPRVATYDLRPQMSAEEVASCVLQNMSHFDFTVVNFANPDMVGHTGNLKATVRACEVVDKVLGKIMKACQSQNQIAIITADHGNAEQMINPNTGEPHTEHTINPVPFILVSSDPAWQNPLRTNGGEHGLILSDISPTILKIMNLPVPPDMTGKSLVE